METSVSRSSTTTSSWSFSVRSPHISPPLPSHSRPPPQPKTATTSPLTPPADFPPLTAKKGKIIWIFTVPIYWALGFIVAGAVPQLGDISSLVGAFCIGNFTYTFPALLKIGFEIKKGAMLPSEGFDQATGKYVRHDGGMKRWIRGYKKSFFLTSFNIFYFLGALVVCGMGSFSAIKALITAFNGGTVATAFSCISPLAG